MFSLGDVGLSRRVHLLTLCRINLIFTPNYRWLSDLVHVVDFVPLPSENFLHP